MRYTHSPYAALVVFVATLQNFSAGIRPLRGRGGHIARRKGQANVNLISNAKGVASLGESTVANMTSLVSDTHTRELDARARQRRKPMTMMSILKKLRPCGANSQVDEPTDVKLVRLFALPEELEWDVRDVHEGKVKEPRRWQALGLGQPVQSATVIGDERFDMYYEGFGFLINIGKSQIVAGSHEDMNTGDTNEKISQVPFTSTGTTTFAANKIHEEPGHTYVMSKYRGSFKGTGTQLCEKIYNIWKNKRFSLVRMPPHERINEIVVNLEVANIDGIFAHEKINKEEPRALPALKTLFLELFRREVPTYVVSADGEWIRQS